MITETRVRSGGLGLACRTRPKAAGSGGWLGEGFCGGVGRFGEMRGLRFGARLGGGEKMGQEGGGRWRW